MASQTDTSWIVEGATVAEYDLRYRENRASFTTIERLTATQIVCANGNRYRRDTLTQVGGGRGELRRTDDPGVRNSVAGKTLSHLRFEVDNLCKDHRGGADAVLATLEQIEKAVREARDAITGTE